MHRVGFILGTVLNINGNNINSNILIAGTPVQLTRSNPLEQQVVSDSFQKGSSNIKPSFHVTVPTVRQLYPQQLLKFYAQKEVAQNLLDSNPVLKEKLQANGLEAVVHPESVTDISTSHLRTTTAYALQIANAMNLSSADKKVLEQACVFHDFGKILIPTEVLNKPGELTPEEKKVMDLHADFGYELLSNTTIDKRVLNLVKNHHMPQAANNDILGQILSVADIYSALREQRIYKKPLTQQQAMQILDQKAQKGEVSTEVVNTLKSVVINSLAA